MMNADNLSIARHGTRTTDSPENESCVLVTWERGSQSLLALWEENVLRIQGTTPYRGNIIQ